MGNDFNPFSDAPQKAMVDPGPPPAAASSAQHDPGVKFVATPRGNAGYVGFEGTESLGNIKSAAARDFSKNSLACTVESTNPEKETGDPKIGILVRGTAQNGIMLSEAAHVVRKGMGLRTSGRNLRCTLNGPAS